MATTLVMGGSGFLGSHVVRKLCERGESVRMLVRESSDTSATDHLDVERVYGDVMDPVSLAAALQGCRCVYYCVVDTRAWLRDPAPLYQTNVQGLRNTLDAALSQGVERFVYTSTFATIGINPDGPSTEADACNWLDEAPAYVRCRVAAEELFVEYCQQRGLPGVVCCVGNTYGEGDIQPTPHGNLVKQVALGRMPCFWDGGGPTLNIKDAAEGMLAAAQRGRIGERYILAGPYLSYESLFAVAAEAAGRRPPAWRLSPRTLRGLSRGSEVVCRLLRVENMINEDAIACSHRLPSVDCSKADRELGWRSGDPLQAVREAAAWYLANP
jgi:dihydroflavonol-4-reductase